MTTTDQATKAKAPSDEAPDLGQGRARRRGGRGGFIALELVLVTLVMLVALQIFVEIMLATSRQRTINSENSIAMEASRSTVEHMLSLPLADIFALYNENPSDDPGGVGTAPGSSFEVVGLTPASTAANGMQGKITFPVAAGAAGVLREDVTDRDLAMPRDLNGDLVVDGADHSGDYSILPVRLVISWRGRSGDRSLSQHVLLTEMNL